MTEDSQKQVTDLLEQAADALERQEGERAIALAQEAMDRDPEHPLAQNLFGLCLLQQQRYPEAQHLFEQLIERYPDRATLRFNAGVAALQGQQPETALTRFRRAIDIDPKYQRAFGFLALVHLMQDELSFARAALLEAGLSELADRLEECTPQESLKLLRSQLLQLPGAMTAPYASFTDTAIIPGATTDEQPPPAEADEQAADPQPGEAPADASPEAVEQDATAEAAPEPEPPATTTAPEPEAPTAPEEPDTAVDTREPPPPPTCPSVEPDGDMLFDGTEGKFSHRGKVVVMQLSGLSGGMHLREDLLLLQQGELSKKPTPRRRKGKNEEPLQLTQGAFHWFEGIGTLAVQPPPGCHLHLLTLRKGACYLSLRHLVAFSASLGWENGFVPPDPYRTGEEIITLRGTGQAIISCTTLQTLNTDDSLTWVSAVAVAGWSGAAVPMRSTDHEAEAAGQIGFEGVGVVWLDLPG